VNLETQKLSGDILLAATGNRLLRPAPDTQDMTKIAVIFCEENPLPDEEYRYLAQFKAVITGSTWNQQILTDHGLPCYRVIQGVDTDLFRYQPKRRLRDRFVVFSGGQLVYRKGQDLLLKAFSIFAQKRPEALLMTAWRSPWEGADLTHTINASRVCGPFVALPDMRQAIKNWVVANGVPAGQFIELGAVPNRLMPDIYREVDLAVFPNRCEGGTNLVAMEALSAGVKCAISCNTGHLDIISRSNCTPLTRQKPIQGLPNCHMDGWGESDVDEIIDVLERAYAGTLPLDVCSIRGSMQHQTWERAISQLLTEVELIAG
jgi:glycosyltransferase involved in cell wall biosynthesis